MIGPVAIPPGAEPTHFLICGSIGSGKSQIINRISDSVRSRSQPAVIIDPGGELMSNLWMPGDIILNPLDSRCHRWDLFGEIDGAWDYDRMARVLVPSGAGDNSSAEWRGYAQSLVSAIISRLHKNNESILEMVRLATTADSAELAQFVAGKPAAALTAKGADKMLASVRGILGTAIAPWQYMPDNRPAFTFRKWLKNPTGFVWLPARADHRSLLAPLFSAMVGSFVTALLSMPPKLDRRIWAFLDEMPALGRIEGIERALSEGRKFGLCAVVGIQSVSQIRSIYGREESQTLLAVMRNWVILNQSDPDSAKYFSDALGQQEIIRPQRSTSDNGESTSYQYATQQVILPSQLTGLPTLSAYLRMSGDSIIKYIRVPIITFERQTEPFVRIDA
jgi:type IV secretory pathway TraG/TraD family ATPase VirD4